MSINQASIPLGATAFTPTGGSATTLKTRSQNANSMVAFLDEDSALLLQKTATFSVTPSKVSSTAPNGYTQARSSLTYKSPYTLDNGAVTVNTVRVELAADSELTPAERKTLRYNAALLLLDSDFDEFWDEQAIS
jgi:predicted peptidase